jgi:hypothetical protein
MKYLIMENNYYLNANKNINYNIKNNNNNNNKLINKIK